MADDVDSLSEAAAAVFLASVMAVEGDRDVTIGLAGGSTPKKVHQVLAKSPMRDAIPWKRIRFLWSDERCVAPDHPDSNYGMAKATLLDHVPFDPEKVHRMVGEAGPTDGSSSYAELISRQDIVRRGQNGDPSMDLIFLGMGDDGHTASLFPYTSALHDVDHLVAAGYNKKLESHRITFTPRMINAAKLVCFVVNGKGKASMLKKILEGEGPVDEAPSRSIRPASGGLLWLLDREAASELSPKTIGD